MTAQASEVTVGLAAYSDIAPIEAPVGSFVSLYAGAGGLDIGFVLAGFVPSWVSELETCALRTHDAVLADLALSRPHLAGAEWESRDGDLLAIPDDELPAEGSADLVIGGPPCQGFSVAGKMDPNDDRSKHVFHFLDIVDRVKPKAFVLENVKALYQSKRWSGIRDQLLDLSADLGYSTRLSLVNASHFGVPQARERMILMGVRTDVGEPGELVATTASSPPTVRDALAQLPPFGYPGNDTACTAKITFAKSPVLRRSPYAGMLFNGAGRPMDPDAPSFTLAASMGGNKTPILDQSLLEGGTSSWVVDYHARLWEGVDESRLTSDPPKFLRRLTVEEAAALQTFPAGMEWFGPQSAKFRQIGNAVPPRLGFAVALAVKKALRI